MEVLVIDVGETRVKFRLSRSDEVRRFRSGRDLTPERLVEAVRDLVTEGARGAGVQELIGRWLDGGLETVTVNPARAVS